MKFQASLGNHDRPENVSYKLFNMNGQRYYTYARKNVRFFALDSTRMDREAAGVARDVAARRAEDWKICYFHHPLYSNAEPARLLGRSARGAGADLRQARRRRGVLRPRPRLRASEAAEGHLLLRVRRGRAAAKREHGPTEETAAYFDQDQSFMLAEVAGDDMHFQAISRTGKIVDSGVIRRTVRRWTPSMDERMTRPGRRESAGCAHRVRCARVPRLSRFAVEHLLLLPLGGLIALVWVNTAPESYYRSPSRSRLPSTTSPWRSSSR